MNSARDSWTGVVVVVVAVGLGEDVQKRCYIEECGRRNRICKKMGRNNWKCHLDCNTGKKLRKGYYWIK